MQRILFTAALLFCAGLSAEPLMQATRSWDGGGIAYPAGDAEITAVILRLEEGSDPPFHCHPVPTMGYVLKGSVAIDTAMGKSHQIGPGEPLVEVMNTVHRGRAVDGPAEIIVFYAGAVGVPVTVRPDQDADREYCR